MYWRKEQQCNKAQGMNITAEVMLLLSVRVESGQGGGGRRRSKMIWCPAQADTNSKDRRFLRDADAEDSE